MRNWVNGPHFPDAAKVRLHTSLSDEAQSNLTDEHRNFLSTLGEAFRDCEWTENAIGECIRETATKVGIGGRDAYVAIYWAVLGKHHGPKASSLIAEMERDSCIDLIG